MRTLIITILAYLFFAAQLLSAELPTIDSEATDFLVFLQDKPKEDQQYIKGFTSYALPQELRDTAALQLSFIIHSMVGISDDEESSGAYYPIALSNKDPLAQIQYFRKVPNSETLLWIDIRDYNWTNDSWERITKFDGYVVEPIISHENNGLLRLLSGNALVRTDWFIFHAARTVEQTDKDNKVNPIYRELLYSKTKQPKTVPEFEAVWGLVNRDNSRKLGNEFGTLVTKSKNVARHNRMLFGYRTEIGWYYRSYDVKLQQGKRDYVERFYEFGGKPPDIYDGGEIFASNTVQLQVYDLYDGQEKLADFADATIVRHLTDVLGDARVVTPHGCFDCHAEGPIPSENTISEFLKSNGNVYYTSKANQLRVERTFLNKKFEESISEHQELYKKALLKVNGLEPAENIKDYYKIISWYNKPVDLEQAAIECGVTPEEFKIRAAKGLQDRNGKIPGRLALLLASTESIPRDIWEAPNTDKIPGIFQQTMIVLNGLTEIVTKIDTVEYIAYVNEKCIIYKGGNEKIRDVKLHEKIMTQDQTMTGFTSVTLEDGTKGWIESTKITKGKINE